MLGSLGQQQCVQPFLLKSIAYNTVDVMFLFIYPNTKLGKGKCIPLSANSVCVCVSVGACVHVCMVYDIIF